MSGPLAVWECERCGARVYPPRPLCPRCGANAWRRHAAAGGVLEEATSGPATPLGSVRTDAGPVVICRLAPGLEPGARVGLSVRASRSDEPSGEVLEARRA